MAGDKQVREPLAFPDGKGEVSPGFVPPAGYAAQSRVGGTRHNSLGDLWLS
jgi:hypothetical protein